MLAVTSIKFSVVKPVPKRSATCAWLSLGISNAIVIHGVRLMKKGDEFIVLMPSREISAENKKPVVTYLSDSVKESIRVAVVGAYLSELEKNPKGFVTIKN